MRVLTYRQSTVVYPVRRSPPPKTTPNDGQCGVILIATVIGAIVGGGWGALGALVIGIGLCCLSDEAKKGGY